MAQTTTKISVVTLTDLANESVVRVVTLTTTFVELMTSSGPWFMWLMAKTVMIAKRTPIMFTIMARSTEVLFDVFTLVKTCGVQQSMMPTLTVRRKNESRTLTRTIVVLQVKSCLAPVRIAWWTLARTAWVLVVLPTCASIRNVPRLWLARARQCGALGIKRTSSRKAVVGNVLSRNTSC